MKRFLIFLGGALVLFIGCMEMLCQSQVVAYQTGIPVSSGAVDFSRAYIRIRSFLPFSNSDGYVIANSYHLARVEESSYQDAAKRSGVAIKGLLEIANSNNPQTNPWSTEAAYQALVILNALPWDESLRSVSGELTQILKKAIEGQNTSEEIDAVRSEIEIQKSRMDDSYTNQFYGLKYDNEEREWSQRLADVRVNMAKCSSKYGEAREDAWALLNDGFGINWLARKSIEGMDIMRIRLVKMISSNENCLKFVSRYDSMIKTAIKGSDK